MTARRALRRIRWIWREHRLAILMAIGGAVVIAVAAHSSSEQPRSAGLTPLQQSAACRAMREGAEQFAREHPEGPVAQMRAQAERVCREGAQLAPVAAEPPAKPSPGCHALRGARTGHLALRRRAVEPPSRPVPFFARRAGSLPANGSPTVGGVKVPRGSRCPRYWATDSPVSDPTGLASRLAAVFPRTGLWPVLWEFSEDPDHYMAAAGNPAAAGRLDAADVLRTLWRQLEMPGRFPGPAPAGTRGSSGSPAPDPFDTVASLPTYLGQAGAARVLLLVPVNRPADVVSVLGPEETEYMSDNALTSVLRSWEERYGAVVTTMGPGTLGLVVDAPPRNGPDALELANEQALVAPDDEESSIEPGARQDLARRLLSGTANGNERSRSFWPIGWPD